MTVSYSGTPGLTGVVNAVLPAGTHVLTVGVGKQYATLSAAIAASADGDVIRVDAGTYTNDFATITHKITIEGMGGMVNMVATIPPPNSKGILVVDNDVTIKNLSFSGVAISAALGGNGAGIRYEGGQMVLINDAFIGNQNGVMGVPVIAGLTNTVSLDHCLFSGNGSGTGQTHNFYIGAVASLTATNSIFEKAVVGHEFKSRAMINDIENNIFRDGPTGTASYSIDLPNGGVDLIKNNLIEKGPLSQQSNMIHFGGEGIPYAGSSLTVTGNSFVNDRTSTTVGVLNQTPFSVSITGNQFTAIPAANIARGPAVETSNIDGSGASLPDSTLTGVLPGSSLLITDALPHTVTLTGALTAVVGGAGLLTVTAINGHVTAIGGSGGLNYTEVAPSGGNLIGTVAGSVNTLVLSGQDTVDSEGTDRIVGGTGNISAQVGGAATIDDGTGANQWTVTGTAAITGHGGSTVVNVGTGAAVTLNGAYGYLAVQTNGGTTAFDIFQGGAEEAVSITGGGVIAKVYSGQTTINTAASATGATIRLGAGKALLSSLGKDTIYAGSGNDTVIVSGQATVYAGTGALTLYNHGSSGAKLYGNGGDYLISGDGGNVTYYGGALASTIEAQLGYLTLIGGAGRLTVNGGARETIIGGSGGLTYLANATSAANTITTLAGTSNLLSMTGANVVNSWGSDVIYGGSGNQLITVHGNSTVNGSTGVSTVTFSGTDTLNGVGNDRVTVTAGANATIHAGSLATVQETGASVQFSIGSGVYAASATIVGGVATVTGGTGTALSVSTQAGTSTAVTLTSGPASVYSRGSDVITGGSGADTVTITAANTQIWGGSGSLTVTNYDWTAGHVQTVHGGSGSATISAGAGVLTFIGGSGSAVITAGSGSLYLTGGSGSLTASGGAGATRFIGGSGTSNLTLNPAGGEVTFGTGNTTVQVAGWGSGVLFDFVAGAGGGVDLIKGFRVGTDKLALVGGVAVQSQSVIGGSASLVLTDGTKVQLAGVTTTAHLFG